MPSKKLYKELPEFNSLKEGNQFFYSDDFNPTSGQIAGLPVSIISGLGVPTLAGIYDGVFTNVIEIFVDTSNIEEESLNAVTATSATLIIRNDNLDFEKTFDPTTEYSDGFGFRIESEELATNEVDNEGVYTFMVEVDGFISYTDPDDDLLDPVDTEDDNESGDTGNENDSGGGSSGGGGNDENGPGGGGDPPFSG